MRINCLKTFIKSLQSNGDVIRETLIRDIRSREIETRRSEDGTVEAFRIDQNAREFSTDVDRAFKELQAEIDEKITSYYNRRDGNISVEDLTEIQSIVSRMYNEGTHQFRKTNEMIKRFHKQLSDSGAKGGSPTESVGFVRSSLTQVAEQVHNSVSGSQRWFNHHVEELFDAKNLDKSDKPNLEVLDKASELWEDALRGGTKLFDYIKEKKPELTTRRQQEKYLMEALENRNVDKKDYTSEIGAIVASAGKLDDLVVNKLNQDNPQFKFNKEHVHPLSYDAARLQADRLEFIRRIEEEAEVEALIGRTDPDLTGKIGKELTGDEYATVRQEIREAAQEVYDHAVRDSQFETKSGYQTSQGMFNARKVRIRDQKTRIDFHLDYGRMEFGIIGGFLRHRQNLLKKTAMFNMLGGDVGYTLQQMKQYSIDRYGISTTDATVAFDKVVPFFESLVGKRPALTTTEQNIVRTTSNLFSGLAGFSAVRNVLYDTTMHSGFVRNMIFDEGGLGNIAKAYGGVLNHLTTGRQESIELAKLFESQGITIEISQNAMNQGLREAADTLALDVAADAGRGARSAKWAAQKTERMGQWLGKWTGADATNRAARTYNMSTIGQFFLRAADKKFADFDDVMRRRMLRFDIGEPEWNLVKKLPILKSQSGKDVMFQVELRPNELTDFVSKNKKTIDSLREAGETDIQAAQRIISNFKLFNDEALNQIVSLTSLKGAILENRETGLISALFRTAVGKFSNITFSQWFDIHRAIYDGMGYNPNLHASWKDASRFKDLDFISKYSKYMVYLMTAQAVGGIAYMWTTDMLKGYAPRDVANPDSVYRALSMNGFGGVMGWMGENLFYHSDDISTPASAFIRAGKKTFKGASGLDADKAISGAVDLSQKLFFPLNHYLARAALQRGLKESILGVDKPKRNKTPIEDWLAGEDR